MINDQQLSDLFGWKPLLGGVFKLGVVVHPYLGQGSNLTNIFQMGWFNHQLVYYWFMFSECPPDSNTKKGYVS